MTFDAATAGELRALRRASSRCYRDLERDPATRAAIKAIESLKAQLAQPPAGLPTCHRSAEPPTSGQTAIDGVWRMKTDREAAGTEGLGRELGGLGLRVRSRQVRDHPAEPEACTWGYGTFSVVRNQMTWTFTDGGGLAPNGAQNKPGEHFVFGLSAYRDTLTVTPVKGAISPATSAPSRGAASRAHPRGGSSVSAARRPPRRCPVNRFVSWAPR